MFLGLNINKVKRDAHEAFGSPINSSRFDIYHSLIDENGVEWVRDEGLAGYSTGTGIAKAVGFLDKEMRLIITGEPNIGCYLSLHLKYAKKRN